MKHDLFITIPRSIEGLEEAAEQILDPASKKVVIENLRIRRRWKQIKEEYSRLKKDIGGSKAIRILSEKHHYSEKTIEKIVYGG